MVFARERFCRNYTLSSSQIRCHCRVILGSVATSNGVNIFQLTNVRLVRLIPDVISSSKCRFRIDSSRVSKFEIPLVDLIQVPKILYISEHDVNITIIHFKSNLKAQPVQCVLQAK